MTPAQAYGHPNFVTDVPIQGPTDEGMRRLACCWTRTHIPQTPACVDCEGPIPMWTQHSLNYGNRVAEAGAGLGDPGLGNPFALALAGPSDPAVDKGLAIAQLAWVQNSLLTLNNKIMSTSGSACPTWADPTAHLPAAVGCFQTWWNANYTGSGKPGNPLRTDGVLDEDTLCSLVAVAQMHAPDFPTPFPDPNKQFCKPVHPLVKAGNGLLARWEHLSTPLKVGVVVGAAAVVGGTVYAVTRPRKPGKR
jgi:hypothetical protein